MSKNNPLQLDSEAIREISDRLETVCYSLSAMNELSLSALCDGEKSEHYLTAIREMSRANLRGVSACVDRLVGAPTIGAHELTEFETF